MCRQVQRSNVCPSVCLPDDPDIELSLFSYTSLTDSLFSNGRTAFSITYEQALYVLSIDFRFRRVNGKVRTFAAVVGSSSFVEGTLFLKWGTVFIRPWKPMGKVRTFAAVVGSSSLFEGTILLKWGTVCFYQALEANAAVCCGTTEDGVLLSASGYRKKQCTVVGGGYEGSKYHYSILYLSRHSCHAKALGHVQFWSLFLAVWVFGLYC